LRIKLYTYKRGQKREEKILDPKLKERQMQAQLEVKSKLPSLKPCILASKFRFPRIAFCAFRK